MSNGSIPPNVRYLPARLQPMAEAARARVVAAILRGEVPPASRATASLHEAGHATAAAALGAPVTRIRLVRQITKSDQLAHFDVLLPRRAIVEWGGETRWTTLDAWIDSALMPPPGSPRDIHVANPIGVAARANVILAGSVAEDMLSKTKPVMSALSVNSAETLQAIELARVLSGLRSGAAEPEATLIMFDWMLNAARQILHVNETALRRVEKLLLHYDRLQSRKLHEHLRDLHPFDLAGDCAARLDLLLPVSWPRGAAAWIDSMSAGSAAGGL
jgi:hypothetical protein